MVEGAALEMLYRGNSIVGSNPTLSAIFLPRKPGGKRIRMHLKRSGVQQKDNTAQDQYRAAPRHAGTGEKRPAHFC